MERTEKLMMKAIVRYREDQDLENAIDFVQKKVKKNASRPRDFQTQQQLWCGDCVVFVGCSSSAVASRATRTGLITSTLSVQTEIPVWRPVGFLSPAAFTCRTRSEGFLTL